MSRWPTQLSIGADNDGDNGDADSTVSDPPAPRQHFDDSDDSLASAAQGLSAAVARFTDALVT